MHIIDDIYVYKVEKHQMIPGVSQYVSHRTVRLVLEGWWQVGRTYIGIFRLDGGFCFKT